MTRIHKENLITAALTIPQQRYAALVAKAGRLGFDVSRLIKDPHHILKTKTP